VENSRYVIVEPIKGGTVFYGVNDVEKDLNLVYIHKDVPCAEFVCKIILNILNHKKEI
jgi:hypothetical protein